MFKKLFLSAAVALTALSASAALPSVTLKDINGNNIDTATLSNDGKPFVISFFATWCKPCLRELKAIHEVLPDWQDETGVRVVAVSIDEAQNEQKVKPLVEGKGWSEDYQVLLDPANEFKRQMGVNDIPHVFVVDGNGNIVWNHQGYVDGGEEDILEAVIKATE
ncbi:MAG: TlpA family protein disulfide reductase [Muribaculaceae bacterium]|nr:TlpA family protein disulfide reductase [Muribaculaceae bacterium]